MCITNRLRFLPALAVPAALTWGACGTTTEPAKVPETVEEEEAPDESWDTTEDAKPKPASNTDTAPELRRSSRPELKLSHSSKIETSVDSFGAELRLGGKASLVFPVEALAEPVAYSFAQRKGPKGPKRIGLNYTLAPAVSSLGEPFVLELALPDWAKKANFAVFHTVGAKRRDGWTVIAATRVDRERGVAIWETSELPEGLVYLTPQAPD